MTDKPMSDFERACAAGWNVNHKVPWDELEEPDMESTYGDIYNNKAQYRRGMVAAFREIRDAIPPGSALTRDGIDELIRQAPQEREPESEAT